MKWFYRMSSFCFVNDNILSYSSLQAACFMIIILRAFELACSMQTTDVTNDNSVWQIGNCSTMASNTSVCPGKIEKIDSETSDIC